MGLSLCKGEQYRAENALKVEGRGRKGENIQLRLKYDWTCCHGIWSYPIYKRKLMTHWCYMIEPLLIYGIKKMDTFYGIFINNGYFPIFVNTEQRHAAVIKLTACSASVMTFWEVFGVNWLFLSSEFCFPQCSAHCLCWVVTLISQKHRGKAG